MKYLVKNTVEIEFTDGELFIIDNETGFVGTGNKYAYQVLCQMNEARTKEEIIQNLKTLYSEDQYPRIEKSVPKIIDWAMEREIIKQIQ